MIGKNTIKLINSLTVKKYRKKENLFLIEGDKMVNEAIHSNLTIQHLIISGHFAETLPSDISTKIRISEVSETELKKISLLQNPQNSIAICQIPEQPEFPDQMPKGLSLFLDGIQDPGNMGTIIRLCDWYGIKHLFCSPDSVDLYNPKVIQASMGSFCRVVVHECEFTELFTLAQSTQTPCFGAFMNGTNIYHEKLPQDAVLILGNEGNGIRSYVEEFISNRISIPNFSENETKAESLNVSVAAAIICSEFKRNYSK